MQFLHEFSLLFTLFFFSFAIHNQAFECQLNQNDPHKVSNTIIVNQSGKGNFKSIQRAIDSIPSNNNKWIRIVVSAGKFNEKITVPPDKPCIFFEGDGKDSTFIQWNDHESTDSSATVTLSPVNIVVKGITFMNTYNIPRGNTNIRQALAIRIYGDKTAFYDCGFIGVQDTIWDASGRHYFKGCYIEGAFDFIWGSAQSIYERCHISVNLNKYAAEWSSGYITANGRNSRLDQSAFVFKDCTFNGVGNALLGRAYGSYSRVIIYNSMLSNVILPQGWDAWHCNSDQIGHLEYVEFGNRGPGADTSKRVSWMKKISDNRLKRFVDVSFIDKEGWIAKLPRI